MAAHPELKEYIDTLRKQNVDDTAIRNQLERSGWDKSDIEEAMTMQPATATTLPPPPVPRFGMWIAFEYVILFISLYVSATALGGVLHHMVDEYVIDSLNRISDSYSYTYSSSYDNWWLKMQAAGLIVAFPIFIYLFYSVKKELITKPGIKNLRARKIFIYLTMVGTFCIMLGHLIWTIYSFLDGKASINAIAHLGVTFLVAGSIFFYLLIEVKEDRKSAQ